MEKQDGRNELGVVFFAVVLWVITQQYCLSLISKKPKPRTYQSFDLKHNTFERVSHGSQQTLLDQLK